MGNAGGGNGEKGEGNDELEMVWAFIVAVFAATVAYRVWRLLSRGSSAPQEAQKVWSPPPEDYLKLNTDFSGPSGSSGPSGIGWLIRNHLCDMVDCGAEQVYLPRNFIDENSGGVAVHIGEALALLKGLEKVRDFGCRNVIAETDHKSNVNCINNDRYKGNNYITQIREARDTWFNKCQVTHIDREANRCANHLASIGMRQGTRSYEQLRDSPDLNKLLQQDSPRLFTRPK